MKQPISRRFFVFCLAATALAGSAFGQDDKSLVGTWSMTSETGEDPVPWTLTLKEVDGKLTAAMDAGDGEKPAKDFTYADGMLSFKANYQNIDYEVKLKATTDKLTGTWSGNGDSGKTTGIRK